MQLWARRRCPVALIVSASRCSICQAHDGPCSLATDRILLGGEEARDAALVPLLAFMRF